MIFINSKISTVLFSLFLLFQISSNVYSSDFSGFGVGGHISFVSPKEHDGAFGGGGHMIFEWDLREAGLFQYHPEIDMWISPYARDKTKSHITGQLYVNPLEMAYFFPVPDGWSLQAYMGASAGTVFFGTIEKGTHDWTEDPDYAFGMSLFGGFELRTLKVAVPFGELRINTGKYSAVKLSVGLILRTVELAKNRKNK